MCRSGQHTSQKHHLLSSHTQRSGRIRRAAIPILPSYQAGHRILCKRHSCHEHHVSRPALATGACLVGASGPGASGRGAGGAAASCQAGEQRQHCAAAMAAARLVGLEKGGREKAAWTQAGRWVGKYPPSHAHAARFTYAAAHVQSACSQHTIGEQEAGEGKCKGRLHGGTACGVFSPRQRRRRRRRGSSALWGPGNQGRQGC